MLMLLLTHLAFVVFLINSFYIGLRMVMYANSITNEERKLEHNGFRLIGGMIILLVVMTTSFFISTF